MNLPENSIAPTQLYKLQYGTIRSWLLTIAVEFKIFNHTVKNKTADEVALELNTHKANTELFLNGLCAIGLLSKHENSYINTELSETFLKEGKETYLGSNLLLNEDWNFKDKEQMKNLLINGPLPPQESIDYSGDYFADHVKSMRNFARSGTSQLVAKELSSLPEFPKMKSMLELGGAHGMDSIATVKKSTTLKGIVFDKPAVIQTTREIISEYNMEEKIDVMGGDYSTDSIGSGYDLVYAKATLNFYKDNLTPIFRKIYEALNPGGVFVSIHDGLNEEKTQPDDMVISWLATGMSSVDLSLERNTIPEALLESGFRNVQTKPHFFSMGVMMDMTIARK